MAFLDTVLRDARHAMRTLCRTPGFTALAVLIIALGIGANTAIFSLVSAVMLKPLPFAEPDRLVFAWVDASAVGGSSRNVISLPNYVDWRERSQSFEDLAAFQRRLYNLVGDGEPEQLDALRTTPNLLSVLGVQAIVGRTFAADEVAEATPVVVVSESLWARRFGADSNVVGREIVLDGARYTVIGVVPPYFRFPENVDVFMPTAFTPAELANRGIWDSYAVGRLRAGVTIEQAQTELNAIAKAVEEEVPSIMGGRGVALTPLAQQLAREARPTLLTLVGAVGVLLLIACANLANLLLARGAGRRHELALRKALGAGDGRVVRQLLTESGVLAAGGVALGLVLAAASLGYLARLVPDVLPAGTAPALDWRVLAFTAAAALVTVLLFGTGPAWLTARSSVNLALHKGAGRSGIARGNRLRSGLVVAEIALTAVLLAAAGLLLRSYAAVVQEDPGFDPSNLLVTATALPPSKYADPARRSAFYEGALREVRALPGVESAGYAMFAPLTIQGGTLLVTVEGAPPITQETFMRYVVNVRVITPGYLETLGLPLIGGRQADDRDLAEGAPRTLVINQTMAERYWPNDDAVGKRMKIGGQEGEWWTVIGVVGDMRQNALDAPPEPELYPPVSRNVPSGAFFWPRQLVVRTTTDPHSLASAVRDAIWRVDPDQPVSMQRTMDEIFDGHLANRNTQLTLVGAFAVLALLLAAVGLYGVLSYTVTQRTAEIGLRMALGASGGALVRAIVRGALVLACIGLAVGVAGALALTRLIESFLFGVSATDPLTFVAAAGLLLVVTAAAAYVPARRAANVDPMTALRDE
jgi:putative ABC transport system permease protein